ncbi:MAG TPA: hypothetical protein VHJ17_06365 [Thermomonospora sp.]|nr:hypothetical protein [Thermomonospora sp.]
MTPPAVRTPEPTTQDAVLRAASEALRTLAEDRRLRDRFHRHPELRGFLRPGAFRYIVAADLRGALAYCARLADTGYRIGLEAAREEATTDAEVAAVVTDHHALVECLWAWPSAPVQLGVDLANVGLLRDMDAAVAHTGGIADRAAHIGSTVMLSMDRSTFTDRVLTAYARIRPGRANVGITLQARLLRTPDDLAEIPRHSLLRLVRGGHAEGPDAALPRGERLDRRYVELARAALDRDLHLTVAAHDARLLEALDAEGVLDRVREIEMPHGVQPALLSRYRAAGRPCRVACVYGDNWWPYFLHRLAEHPPSALAVLADLAAGRTLAAPEYT